MEQTEQIMKCYPERGTVKAYSQIAIQFICQSKVKYEHQIITKNYALSDQELVKRKESEEDYTYSAIFEFEGVTDKKQDIVPVTLIGRGICPKIKISKALLNFGECQVHDHRESMFLIENVHPIPIETKIPRIPQFFVDPDGAVLSQGVKSSFITTFQPSTVGKFKTQIFVTLINGQYKIPIQVVGESNNFLDSKLQI